MPQLNFKKTINFTSNQVTIFSRIVKETTPEIKEISNRKFNGFFFIGLATTLALLVLSKTLFNSEILSVAKELYALNLWATMTFLGWLTFFTHLSLKNISRCTYDSERIKKLSLHIFNFSSDIISLAAGATVAGFIIAAFKSPSPLEAPMLFIFSLLLMLVFFLSITMMTLAPAYYIEIGKFPMKDHPQIKKLLPFSQALGIAGVVVSLFWLHNYIPELEGLNFQ